MRRPVSQPVPAACAASFALKRHFSVCVGSPVAASISELLVVSSPVHDLASNCVA